MKLLYISGPFGHADPIHGIEANILRASEIALEAWRKGWAAICPHKNTAGFQHTDIPWETWMEGDIEMVKKCDAVLMIPGWEQSRGACLERDEARRAGVLVLDYRNGIPSPDWVLR
jgi:hypothetical protein